MRARVKAWEDWPTEYQCCEAQHEAMLPYTHLIFELKNTLEYFNYTCSYCDAEIINQPQYRDKYHPQFALHTAIIDIDEGASSNAN